MYEFNYHKASSIDDAKKLQSEAEEGKFMSGGMTLLPTLKMRLARPSDVVDLAGIPDFAGIEVTGDSVTIKAMTPHAAVAAPAKTSEMLAVSSLPQTPHDHP